jgi:Flp pilus assembly protein TadD
MVSRGGIGFGFQGRRMVGGFGISSVRYGGFPYGGYYGYSVISPIIVTPPSIIVVPPPIIVAPDLVDDPPLPPIDPKRFVVIRPDQPAKQNLIPKLEPLPKQREVARVPAPRLPVVPERPVKPGKAPMPAEIKLPDLPLAPAPEANPRAEADRQIELGRSAFAQGEVGRALERFKQATIVAPMEPTAFFFLAQAQFALGKYSEAVASIEAGLKLRPDWPLTRFQSREVYAGNAGLFDAHLRNLRMAQETVPEDPRLMFLLAVELWFDGKRDEAVKWFEQAAKRMPDRTAIERFVELKKS